MYVVYDWAIVLVQFFVKKNSNSRLVRCILLFLSGWTDVCVSDWCNETETSMSNQSNRRLHQLQRQQECADPLTLLRQYSGVNIIIWRCFTCLWLKINLYIYFCLERRCFRKRVYTVSNVSVTTSFVVLLISYFFCTCLVRKQTSNLKLCEVSGR